MRFLPSLSSPGESSSYCFLGAEHEAAVELCKLSIGDIPIPLLHILKNKSNPEVLQRPQVILHGLRNISSHQNLWGKKEEKEAKTHPDFASCTMASSWARGGIDWIF